MSFFLVYPAISFLVPACTHAQQRCCAQHELSALLVPNLNPALLCGSCRVIPTVSLVIHTTNTGTDQRRTAQLVRLPCTTRMLQSTPWLPCVSTSRKRTQGHPYCPQQHQITISMGPSQAFRTINGPPPRSCSSALPSGWQSCL